MIFDLESPRAFLGFALMFETFFFPTHVDATDVSSGWEEGHLGVVYQPISPPGNPDATQGVSIIRLVNDSDVALELRAANASSWADNPIRETGSVVTRPNFFEVGSNKLLHTTGSGSTIKTYLWLCEPDANDNDDSASRKLRIKFDRTIQAYAILNQKVNGYRTAASEDERIGNLAVLRIAIAPGDWIRIR
jgi:hypothetical protein